MRRPIVAGLAVVVGVVAAVLAGCGGSRAGADESPSIRVEDVYAAPASGDVGAVYLTLVNDGGDDTLTGVAAQGAERVEPHRVERKGGLDVMVAVETMDVPAHDQVPLVPLGDHLMLVGLDAPLTPGDTVELELTFRRTGRVHTQGPVLSYDEIDSRLGGTT